MSVTTPGHLADDEHVRAQAEHFVGHVAVNAGDEGDNSDHRRYADHHAKQRQH